MGMIIKLNIDNHFFVLPHNQALLSYRLCHKAKKGGVSEYRNRNSPLKSHLFVPVRQGQNLKQIIIKTRGDYEKVI